MQIVLFILQILGWALLAAFIVVILALLIILFHPVGYLVDIHWLEEQRAKFKASWLFHLIRAKISYGDDLIYGEIHLFLKKITFSRDLTEEKEPVSSEKGVSEINEDKEADGLDASTDSKETSEQGIISKIKGMIERIKEVYPKFKKIITDEKNKEAFLHIKDEFIYLLKVLLPKKTKIDAVFSTGSPDTTGQTFGILACFPAMYQKNWNIIPDFESEELYIKGTIWGKGHIYGYKLVGIILRIVFDKNCRRMYTMISRFIKWIKK